MRISLTKDVFGNVEVPEGRLADAYGPRRVGGPCHGLFPRGGGAPVLLTRGIRNPIFI